MRDIDRELDAVEKAFAAEDPTISRAMNSRVWRVATRVVSWAVVAVVLFVVFRVFWQ